MKRLSAVFNFAGGMAVGVLLITQFAFKSNANKNFRSEAAPVPAEWRAPAIPQQLSFAGESVPLDRWDVRERFDRELLINSYSTANILYLLKLSNRYFPVISERLKANGVPDDFKYLCIAERTSKAGQNPAWVRWVSGSLWTILHPDSDWRPILLLTNEWTWHNLPMLRPST